MSIGNILVTGVSQGLGLQIARALLSRGATVYGISRNRTPEWIELEQAYPGRTGHRAVDLERTESLKQTVFKDFIPNSVRLDGLVNNAAMAYDDLITNLDEAQLRRMYDVNVFAPMLLTKYAIRNMLFHRVAGSIVHVSSISVHTGYKGLAMYASSKGALEAFSKNTAREWGERGIRSNCLVAGFMETNMSASLSAEQKARIYQRTALKTATTVQSVAETVCFLLDQGAASVTGQNLFVDSGTI